MFKKINQKIEKLFDQNSAPSVTVQTLPDVQNGFQIVNNNQMLENLSYIFSNEIDHISLSHLFSQLSSYFEIGFLLRKREEPNLYIVKDAFFFSKKIIEVKSFKPIKLPTPALFAILITKGAAFLNHFGMSKADSGKKMISYLIPISENYTVVVITPTAEPWAKLKVESLQKTFMKINFSL